MRLPLPQDEPGQILLHLFLVNDGFLLKSPKAGVTIMSLCNKAIE